MLTTKKGDYKGSRGDGRSRGSGGGCQQHLNSLSALHRSMCSLPRGLHRPPLPPSDTFHRFTALCLRTPRTMHALWVTTGRPYQHHSRSGEEKVAISSARLSRHHEWQSMHGP